MKKYILFVIIFSFSCKESNVNYISPPKLVKEDREEGNIDNKYSASSENSKSGRERMYGKRSKESELETGPEGPKEPVDCKKMEELKENEIITCDEPGTLIEGLYNNQNWGTLYIKIKDNKVTGTYHLLQGELVGTYNKKTGVIKGIWCGVERDGRDIGGDAEFHFIKKNNKPYFKGKWKEHNNTNWNYNWDFTYQESNLPTNLDRFDKIDCKPK